MNEKILESVRLTFCQGQSDKEYRVQLVQVPDGHVVNFQYGRRDGTLKAGTKTAAALDFPGAKKVFDKLVGSKMAEGYTTDEDGAAFQGSSNEERVSGILPQLLNPIEESELELFLSDDTVVAQQKLDGERRLVRSVADQLVHGINRKGLIVPLPLPVVESVARLSCTLDGELVGGVLWVFDILEYDGQDLTREDCVYRLQVLDRVGKAFGPDIKVVATAYGNQAKRALLAQVRELGQEGVVFKAMRAPYTPGRPNSGGPQRKFKLIESATVRVRSINGSKRSVEVEVSLARKSGEQTVYDSFYGVGSVTIPANHPVPKVGQLVELTYLYCFEAGSLFQPVYKGARTDLDESDLSVIAIEQLKFKRKHEEAMAA